MTINVEAAQPAQNPAQNPPAQNPPAGTTGPQPQ
jgi:hypothetical protein